MPEVLQDGTLTYVYGHGLVSQTDGSGTQTYLLSDGLGSTRTLVDGNGHAVGRYDYDVFGAVRSSSGTGSTDYRFTGEFADGTTSLTYLRARWYDPGTGRFLSKDPFPGFAAVPSSQHAYAYVHNDPVNSTDPSGYCVEDACVLEIALVSTSPYWAPILWASAVTLGMGAVAIAADARDEIGDRLGALWNGCTRAWDDLSTFFAKRDRNPAQDKPLTKADEKLLEKVGGAEKIKEDIVGKHTGRYDLYKDKDGNIYVKPKGGRGEGAETGYNINDLLSQ